RAFLADGAAALDAAVDDGAVGEDEAAVGLEHVVAAAGGDVAAGTAVEPEAAPDRGVDVDEGAAAGGDRRDVQGRAIAELAGPLFDRDREDEGLGGRGREAGVQDRRRVTRFAGAVEDRQRRGRLQRRAIVPGYEGDHAPFADDRPGAGRPRLRGGRVDQQGRVARAQPPGVEPSVAVEAEHNPLHRDRYP